MEREKTAGQSNRLCIEVVSEEFLCRKELLMGKGSEELVLLLTADVNMIAKPKSVQTSCDLRIFPIFFKALVL